MPPSSPTPCSAQDWLRHARSDLAVASQTPPLGALYETLCYHAQQAAEKSLKAVLIHLGVAFPFTHDIAQLITVVQRAGATWPSDLDAAAELTEYAVVCRYPGAPRQVTAADHRAAADVAKRVMDWAESLVAGTT